MDARVDNRVAPNEANVALFKAMEGLNAEAFRLFGNKVLSGPFRGMVIPEKTAWDDGNASTKLFGVYEHELHGVIEVARWRRPKVIVNIGCAEGYYAIGLARLCPEAKVLAFDVSEESRILCEDYAEANDVKVSVLDGMRDTEEMKLSEARRRLYVIDIEGAELDLIDLKRCPDLVWGDIIVECHDFVKPEISCVLAERLARTHRVELIRPRLPDFARYPFSSQFPAIISVMMLVEKRPADCCWLACWSNNRGDYDG